MDDRMKKAAHALRSGLQRRLHPNTPKTVKNLPGEDENWRYIYLNETEKNMAHNYCKNAVQTAKYTVLTFLPKFLYMTFSRVASLYFLVISCLQLVKPISNTNGIPTTLFPLSLVTFIESIFAAVEDWYRHRADDVANALPVKKYIPALQCCEEVENGSLRVGDIIKLHNREMIPADIVVLAVSEPPDAPIGGVCYVETKMLDGETNLKLRQALSSTRGSVAEEKDLGALQGEFKVWSCPTRRSTSSREASAAASRGSVWRRKIKPVNVLLRGCSVRNTEFVYGLVVYTGPESKINKSVEGTSPAKVSRLDSQIGRQIKNLVVTLFAFCALGATGRVLWNHKNLDGTLGTWTVATAGSMIGSSSSSTTSCSETTSCLLALYVSLASVKALQAYFMQQDLAMYHEPSDTPASVRTMTLNDDLGMISYLFSDKTGTLTENIMEFRKMTVAGVSYGRGTTEIGLSNAQRAGRVLSETDLLASSGKKARRGADEAKVPFVNFEDAKLQEHRNGAAGPEQEEALEEFIEFLSLCHTVLPERGSGDDGDPVLSASSPDEQALVSAARFFGHSFVQRAPGYVLVRVEESERMQRKSVLKATLEAKAAAAAAAAAAKTPRSSSSSSPSSSSSSPSSSSSRPSWPEAVEADEQGRVGKAFKVEEVLEFSSSRKRMSVVVRGVDGRLRLLTKGADDVMLSRCACAEGDVKGQAVRSATLRDMEEYAQDGLRTLVCAVRDDLDEEWFQDWSDRLRRAQEDEEQQQLRSRGEVNAIDSAMEEMEKDLRLIGATAVEDRLQLLDNTMRIVVLTEQQGCADESAEYKAQLLTDRLEAEYEEARARFTTATTRQGAIPTSSVRRFLGGGGVAQHGGGGGDEGNGVASGLLRRMSVSLNNVIGINMPHVRRDSDSWTSDPCRNSGSPRSATCKGVRESAREGEEDASSICDSTRHLLSSGKHDGSSSSSVVEEVAPVRRRSSAKSSGSNGPSRRGSGVASLSAAGTYNVFGEGVGQAEELRQSHHVSGAEWEHRSPMVSEKDEESDTAGVEAAAAEAAGEAWGHSMHRVGFTDSAMQLGGGGWAEGGEPGSIASSATTLVGGVGGGVGGGGGEQEQEYTGLALVIDGDCLDTAINNAVCRAALMRFARRCQAVVACRMSPHQKSQLVDLVKEHEVNAHTLSIGDGANDVAMIQRAHVGVGISGQEGMAAVNASDYALAQFRYLLPLLLVHGRNNYIRLSKLACYIFYKNVVMSLTQFWYAAFTDFSGQKWYNEAGVQMFNTIYTALPIILLGVLDRDVAPEVVLRYPRLYLPGRMHQSFNPRVFWWWMFTAVVESLLICTFTMATMDSISQNGYTTGLWEFGGAAFSVVVVVTNIKVAVNQLSWVWVNHVAWWLSVISWFATSLVFSSILSLDWNWYQVFFRLYSMPQFWLLLVVAPTALVILDTFSQAVQREVWPQEWQLVQEAETMGTLDTIVQTSSANDSLTQQEAPSPRASIMSRFLPRALSRGDSSDSATASHSSGFGRYFGSSTTSLLSKSQSHDVAAGQKRASLRRFPFSLDTHTAYGERVRQRLSKASGGGTRGSDSRGTRGSDSRGTRGSDSRGTRGSDSRGTRGSGSNGYESRASRDERMLGGHVAPLPSQQQRSARWRQFGFRQSRDGGGEGEGEGEEGAAGSGIDVRWTLDEGLQKTGVVLQNTFGRVRGYVFSHDAETAETEAALWRAHERSADSKTRLSAMVGRANSAVRLASASVGASVASMTSFRNFNKKPATDDDSADAVAASAVAVVDAAAAAAVAATNESANFSG